MVLKQQQKKVFSSNVRLDDIKELESLIQKTRCRYVICAAGISGRPTVSWCEDNEKETFRVNILQVFNLIELTEQLRVHLTIYGSAMIYESPGS